MRTPDPSDIQECLRQGDTRTALSKAIEYFQQQNKYPLAVRAVRVLEANFSAIRQRELKGLVSFSEAQQQYNNINDALLTLLDHPEDAAQMLPRVPVWQRRSFQIVMLIWLAAAASFVYFQFFREKICPDFERNAKLKIMILPFQNVGAQPAKPEVVIQQKIQKLTADNGISADARTANTLPKNIPQNMEEAGAVGQNCGADFLVWGQFSAATDSIRVNLQFKFCQPQGAGGEVQLAAGDVLGLQSGSMSKSLDDAILSFCGILAMREARWDVAKKWLNKVKNKDTADLQMLDWLDKNQR